MTLVLLLGLIMLAICCFCFGVVVGGRVAVGMCHRDMCDVPGHPRGRK